jgi:hypothetical protein
MQSKKANRNAHQSIDLKEYEILSTIREGSIQGYSGSLGRVKLVKKKTNGKYYCAKIMKK